MRFKVPLLASDEEFERAAALFVFLANAALFMVPPLISFSSPLAPVSTLLLLLDSLAVLLVLLTLGIAPVGRMEADELQTLSELSCCCSSATAAAAAIAAVTGPADDERAARSMETFGVSGEV